MDRGAPLATTQADNALSASLSAVDNAVAQSRPLLPAPSSSSSHSPHNMHPSTTSFSMRRRQHTPSAHSPRKPAVAGASQGTAASQIPPPPAPSPLHRNIDTHPSPPSHTASVQERSPSAHSPQTPTGAVTEAPTTINAPHPPPPPPPPPPAPPLPPVPSGHPTAWMDLLRANKASH